MPVWVKERIEDEVARELTIPEIGPVPELVPTITESQLKEYPKEHQPLVFAMNRVGQYAEWGCDRAVEGNHHLRMLEAQMIRLRKQITRAFWWTIGVVISSVAAAYFMRLFKVL